VRTIVAVCLTVLSILVLVVEWRAYRPSVSSTSVSASQIYIHETPVCVFRHGESIVARVGECRAGATPLDEAPGERLPEFSGPGRGLPPGHPPVGPDSLPGDGARRVLI
jgi:hypothetical protein